MDFMHSMMDSGSNSVTNAVKSRFSNVDRRLEAWNRATGCSLNPALPQSPMSQRLAPSSDAPQTPQKPFNPALILQTPSPMLALRTRNYDVVSRLKDQPSASLDLGTGINPAPDFPAAVSVRDPWVPCSAPGLRTTNGASSECVKAAPVVEVNGFSKLRQSNGEQVHGCCLAREHFDSCWSATWDLMDDAADEAGARCSDTDFQCGDDGDVAGELAKEGKITWMEKFAKTGEYKGGMRRGASVNDLAMRGKRSCFCSRECGCVTTGGSGGSSSVVSPVCKIMSTAPPVFVWAAKRRMERRASESEAVVSRKMYR